MAARARNLAHRNGTLVTVGSITFALVFGLLLWFTRAEREALQRIPVATDTTALARSVLSAMRSRRTADSMLALVPVPVRRTVVRVARVQDTTSATGPGSDSIMTAAPIAVTVPDTATATAQLPDSLRVAIAALAARLQRAQNAPLAASWRALAADPLLQQEARVRALADSLVEAERARNEYDAVGGVDPIYLELSSRVTGIGRAIERSAQQRIDALLRPTTSVAPVALVPVGPSAAELGRRYVFDSARHDEARRRRDAAATRADSLRAQLAQRRREALARDSSRVRAQRRVEALAPPTAMVSASLAAAIGVALLVTLLLELRAPRLADEHEVALQARVPVLLNVRATDAGTPEALTSAFSQLVFDLSPSMRETRTLIVVSDDAPLATRTGTRIAERLGHEGRRVRVVASPQGTDRTTVRATPRAPRGRATPSHALSVLVAPERSRGVAWTGEFSRDALSSDTVTVRTGSLDEVRPALSAGDGSVHVILVVRTGSTPTAWLERVRAEIHRAHGTSALGVVIWSPDIDDVDPVTYAYGSALGLRRARIAAATR